MSQFQTEFPFTLPRGFVDPEGRLHRQGSMRLATAKDEIVLQKDVRARDNPAYGTLIMLSRVITRLGTLASVTPEMLENLFTRDIGYLRELFNRLNQQGDTKIPTQCPFCNSQFAVELALSGGILGYPSDRLYEEVAYVAFHFHWPPEAILDLDHKDRQRWVAEIGKINTQIQSQARQKSQPRPRQQQEDDGWTYFDLGPPNPRDLRKNQPGQ